MLYTEHRWVTAMSKGGPGCVPGPPPSQALSLLCHSLTISQHYPDGFPGVWSWPTRHYLAVVVKKEEGEEKKNK